MNEIQEHYVQLSSEDIPLPVVTNGYSREESIALARAYVHQNYDVMVLMSLCEEAKGLFEKVRKWDEEGDMGFVTVDTFCESLEMLFQEGRRLAYMCLTNGVSVKNFKPAYAGIDTIDMVEHIGCESIAAPHGKTFLIIEKEEALKFMAKMIYEGAARLLQKGAEGAN